MAKFKSIQDLLNDFRDNVIREAKKNLQKKTDTGRLQNSLKSRVKESKRSIEISFEMEEYGFYQDRGVKGVKSGESLDNYRFGTGSGQSGGLTKGINKWVKRKGIQFRDRKTGRFMSHEQTARTIIRSIWMKGIKPSLFFTRPFEKYYKKLPDELMEMFGFEAEQLFKQITDENFKRLNK
jgi:hypothetical protein|tara:strand:+ start:1603 stop:2142 length:540 start_codon:yes stop_codon:yes gene_type:complete